MLLKVRGCEGKSLGVAAINRCWSRDKDGSVFNL